MTLDASGNLGLGVTPSAWGADFKAVQIGTSGGSIANDDWNGYTEILNNVYGSARNTYTRIQSLGATRYSQQFGTHAWYSVGAGSGGATVSFTQAMTLDASGRLGIGTTSPSSLLEVKGSSPIIKVTDTGYTSEHGLIFDAGSNTIRGGLTLNYSTAELRLFAGIATNTYYQTFFLNGSERMRISSGGLVGIGTTSPGHELDVEGVGRFKGALRVGAATAATNVMLSLNGVSGKAQRIQFQNSGTDQWLLGAGAASETSAFELYNATGTIVLSVNKSTNASTFASDVKVKTLEITNVGTDSTSSGVSTYMRITVNGNPYLIPLHGTP
jgi:hypothetical protein